MRKLFTDPKTEPSATGKNPVPMPIPADRKTVSAPASSDRNAAPVPGSDGRNIAPVHASACQNAVSAPTTAGRKTVPVPGSSDGKTGSVPTPTGQKTDPAPRIRTLRVPGVPNERQKQFFQSTARFTAYGGARGGGKSWALRRKLIALCLRYPGVTCLLVRRSLPELRANHLRPLMSEYGGFLTYAEEDKCIRLPNGSRIFLGYCSSERDVLRYQGQEYDIIAIDEATQLSEYQFSIFKACLRGTGDYPRRMYLTCNPGGVGHAWVKRLFVDRLFRAGENPDDYRFIPARVFDNRVLTDADPAYVKSLESLPPRLRDAWLYGRWDVFEGQFFPEFDPSVHICDRGAIPGELTRFVAFDYGFDMLAALLCGSARDGKLYVLSEFCQPGLTIGEAAMAVARLCRGMDVRYAVASPDLWNRRQDTGRSGFEIMQACPGMPPMTPADDRRIPGWRVLREYLRATAPPQAAPGSPASPGLPAAENRRNSKSAIPAGGAEGEANPPFSPGTGIGTGTGSPHALNSPGADASPAPAASAASAVLTASVSPVSPRLLISRDCTELCRCLPALQFDRDRPEDASGEPHAVTHAPEALRYAVMSRAPLPEQVRVRNEFRFPPKNRGLLF